MQHKKIYYVIALVLGFIPFLSAQSYFLRYKWQEGDVYYYKLTVKSPRFGNQVFFYDQIIEKVYYPGDVLFTFKTPLGTFKSQSSDLRPTDGSVILRIVYTKGIENGKLIPKDKLLKNLLLYIKPNGETFVIHRKKIKGVWVFDFVNVLDPEEKNNLRKIIKSPTSVEYIISDNTVLTEYDPDGIFHPVYLPDNPVTVGEKWSFSMPGLRSDFSFEKMEKIGAYNCAVLVCKTNSSAKEMVRAMPGIPEEEMIEMKKQGIDIPEMISAVMPDMKGNTKIYFDPDRGVLVRLADYTELKGPINTSLDSRLELVSAEIKSENKPETPRKDDVKTEIIKGKESEHNRYVKSSIPDIRTEIKVVEMPENEISPMTSSSFRSFIAILEDESFEDTGLEILEDAADKNHFTVDQLVEIIGLFSFENNKIEACKIVYPKLIDKENSYEIYSSFQFPASKKEIRKWIEQHE